MQQKNLINSFFLFCSWFPCLNMTLHYKLYMNFAKICKYIIDAAEERHMQMQNDNQLFLCMFVGRGGEKCVCHVFSFLKWVQKDLNRKSYRPCCIFVNFVKPTQASKINNQKFKILHESVIEWIFRFQVCLVIAFNYKTLSKKLQIFTQRWQKIYNSLIKNLWKTYKIFIKLLAGITRVTV